MGHRGGPAAISWSRQMPASRYARPPAVTWPWCAHPLMVIPSKQKLNGVIDAGMAKIAGSCARRSDDDRSRSRRAGLVLPPHQSVLLGAGVVGWTPTVRNTGRAAEIDGKRDINAATSASCTYAILLDDRLDADCALRSRWYSYSRHDISSSHGNFIGIEDNNRRRFPCSRGAGGLTIFLCG